MRAKFGDLRRCYEAGLARDRNLAGRVVTRFVIDPSGEVHTAVDAGSTLPDADVVSCIVRHYLELSFPHPHPEGKSVTVVFPIQFDPADDSDAGSG